MTELRAVVDVDEEGWAGTRLVEPLATLAAAVAAGAVVTIIAWRHLWRRVEQQAHTTGVRPA